jgi:hypothetical protein
MGKLNRRYAKETARTDLPSVRILEYIENVPARMDPEGRAASFVRTALVKMTIIPEIIGAGEKVRSAAYRAGKFFTRFHGSFLLGRVHPGTIFMIFH